MIESTESRTPVIAVKHLSKRFGDFTAVDQIAFDVYRGEIFGFLGPNGSGKTTTIRMLLGLLSPTSGNATVLEIDVHKRPQDIARHVGYMSQKFSLYPDLTVDENLTFYGRTYGLHGRTLQQRKKAVLALIRLDDQRQQLTSNLAAGWKQRLALGTAILHQPKLLFLDEPTAGVDPLSRRNFWRLLYTLSEQNTTIFVTTHYMEEAEQCHRLAFIHHGRLIAEGAPAEIKRNRMSAYVVEVICQYPRQAIEALRKSGISEVALYGDRVHAAGADLDQRLSELTELLIQADARPRSVKLIPPSLEDVFIANVR